MSEWQPIETAPNGATVILWCVGQYAPGATVGGKDEEGRWWVDIGLAGESLLRTTGYEPTHWMPLPEPPQSERTGA